MVLNVSQINGISDYQTKVEAERTIYTKNEQAFLVVNKHTIEVRCDTRLGENLREKYESVMESRYFGRGGIEIVPTEQLTETELEDLVRLSYNLTK